MECLRWSVKADTVTDCEAVGTGKSVILLLERLLLLLSLFAGIGDGQSLGPRNS